MYTALSVLLKCSVVLCIVNLDAGVWADAGGGGGGGDAGGEN